MPESNLNFEFCYPSIVIAGVGKCGTSALYRLLADHDQIYEGIEARKEECPMPPLTNENLVGFLIHIWNSESQDKNFLRINGCIHEEVMGFLDKLFGAPKTVYLMMVRGSAYNFWCSPAWDKDCFPGQWTQKGHYRDPVFFHHLVVSSGYESSANFMSGSPFCLGFPGAPAIEAKPESFYTDRIKLLARPDHVLVISKEKFAINPLEEWERIRSFAQSRLSFSLSPHSNISAHKGLRTNPGVYLNDRGADVSLIHSPMHQIPAAADKNPSDDSADGLYEISGFQPMLAETKAHLRRSWKECNYIQQLTEYYSYSCHSASPNGSITSVSVDVSSC
eukprot:CAMPEP_0194567874 /NCGR_PEP_ID=MMETSP0292-20121207/6190_1 /TAXON_ID=39354 /ORGANISM="Heterosigma akashiwo, Strain CCMP2393" /LENGTH=333 /DNA_ID=CAMNT_0039417761 /DNA_START=259 /DNA_END=1260 /DNA_ORIENTATION=+